MSPSFSTRLASSGVGRRLSMQSARLLTRHSSSPLTRWSIYTTTSKTSLLAGPTASILLPPHQNLGRPFSSSTTTMAPSAQDLVEIVKNRRTYYKLGRNSPVPDSEIDELIKQIVQHTPSAFNTQSTRLVVALREKHEKVWNIAIDSFARLVASGVVSEEVFRDRTKPKL
ncbi:hypothetical protein VTN31DRAFT_2260 [Thermomyces dupontii]|uniref:uncharacterized protein n=1 Tax=Talaromyces thermophilus TaxID=28565 RepID=UPI0037424CE3